MALLVFKTSGTPTAYGGFDSHPLPPTQSLRIHDDPGPARRRAPAPRIRRQGRGCKDRGRSGCGRHRLPGLPLVPRPRTRPPHDGTEPVRHLRVAGRQGRGLRPLLGGAGGIAFRLDAATARRVAREPVRARAGQPHDLSRRRRDRAGRPDRLPEGPARWPDGRPRHPADNRPRPQDARTREPGRGGAAVPRHLPGDAQERRHPASVGAQPAPAGRQLRRGARTRRARAPARRHAGRPLHPDLPSPGGDRCADQERVPVAWATP